MMWSILENLLSEISRPSLSSWHPKAAHLLCNLLNTSIEVARQYPKYTIQMKAWVNIKTQTSRSSELSANLHSACFHLRIHPCVMPYHLIRFCPYWYFRDR